MPPIQTAEDIFFYAISSVVVIVGLLIAWSLYYLSMTLRDARRVTKDVRARVEAFWEVIELLREKLQVGGAIFKIAATGIKELAEHFKSFTESESKTKRSKK